MGFLPNECLVIEDSYKGALAATSGGFDVYGYDLHNEDPNFEKGSYQNIRTNEGFDILVKTVVHCLFLVRFLVVCFRR